MRRMKCLDRLLQSVARAAGQVDHDPDVAAIHRREDLPGRRRNVDGLALGDASGLLGAEGHVGVHVDDREPGPLDRRFLHVQHALGFEFAQQKRAFGGRRRLLARGGSCPSRSERGAGQSSGNRCEQAASSERVEDGH